VKPSSNRRLSVVRGIAHFFAATRADKPASISLIAELISNSEYIAILLVKHELKLLLLFLL
jgi:hypothetical protein